MKAQTKSVAQVYTVLSAVVLLQAVCAFVVESFEPAPWLPMVGASIPLACWFDLSRAHAWAWFALLPAHAGLTVFGVTGAPRCMCRHLEPFSTSVIVLATGIIPWAALLSDPPSKWRNNALNTSDAKSDVVSASDA